MIYKIVWVENIFSAASDVNQKRPKLIKEKAEIHNANKFLFSL